MGSFFEVEAMSTEADQIGRLVIIFIRGGHEMGINDHHFSSAKSSVFFSCSEFQKSARLQTRVHTRMARELLKLKSLNNYHGNSFPLPLLVEICLSFSTSTSKLSPHIHLESSSLLLNLH